MLPTGYITEIEAKPRLTMRLEQLLKSQGRLADNKNLSLRTPPSPDDQQLLAGAPFQRGG
jgi:hypothetical protein